MFVKLTQIKDYCYVKVVESYRDEKGVTRHSTICNFGRLDRLKKDKSFVKSISKLYALVNDLEVLEDGTGTEKTADND